MKYTMVKVKKSSGGFRMQRAMVLANGRYKFVSNKSGGGRKKARKSPMAKRRKSRRSTALAPRRRRYHLAKMPRRRGRRRGGGSVTSLLPVALGAAGLAYITGASGPAQVRNFANKIPGAKTFGPLAVLGGAALAIDKLGIYRNKWLRIAGTVGVVAAAIKVGTEGTNFKWVGDSDDIGDYDLADIEGDDDLSDIEGDDDLSDVEDVGDDD